MVYSHTSSPSISSFETLGSSPHSLLLQATYLDHLEDLSQAPKQTTKIVEEQNNTETQ